MKKFQWTRKPDFRNVKNLDYDLYWKQRGFLFNSKLKERENIILNNIGPRSKVLDIGCGNSRLALELKHKNCDIHVADISKVVLNEYNKNGISTHQIDLASLNFADINNEYWDVIILSEVLEHTPNPEEIIDQLRSITDKMIITIPNSAFYKFRFHLMFKGRFFTQWISHPSEHLRFWSHLDFLDWLNALNLEVDHFQASNGFRYYKNTLPNLFGFQMVYFCSTKNQMLNAKAN